MGEVVLPITNAWNARSSKKVSKKGMYNQQDMLNKILNKTRILPTRLKTYQHAMVEAMESAFTLVRAASDLLHEFELKAASFRDRAQRAERTSRRAAAG